MVIINCNMIANKTLCNIEINFCWYNIHNRYYFITHNFWIIANHFYILIILTNTFIQTRIQTRILFAYALIFTLALICLVIPFLVWIKCCTIEFAFTITRNIIWHFFSFIFFVIISDALTFMSFGFTFGIHILGDKTLQLLLHLSKLIMNGNI